MAIKKIYLHFIAIISLCFALNNAMGQNNYPVSSTVVLAPPYSLSLSDYSALGSQKLMLYLYGNDLDMSRVPVKLQLTIESVGITIQTITNIATTPIYMDGGATNVLYGRDLFDYFNLNNLTFSGYSKEAYLSTGQLPEGFYKFSVTVLHYNTNRVISNTGSAHAWIVVGKPPTLKYPVNNDYVGENQGMPITFSWLASNAGSPAATGSIQYKLQLWEMRIDNVNANIVVATIPVFFEQTVFNTAHTFYPSTLAMEPGMSYAWRVTASDAAGLIPFEQNGESEVRTFIYKAPCDSVSNLQGSVASRSGSFTWDGNSMHTSFNIEMRNPLTDWNKSSETYENSANFFDLKYDATYQLRVQSVCNSDPTNTSDFTEWQSIHIEKPVPAYDSASCPDCGCDDDLSEFEIDNFDLRDNLAVEDTIVNKQGSTRLLITEISNEDPSNYEGVCMFWSEIWGLKIPCNFWSLQVNTDNVIVNLELESINDPAFMVDVDAIVDAFNEIKDGLNTIFDYTPTDTVALEQEIDLMYVDEDGNVMVVTVDESGNASEPVSIGNADDLDKTVLVDENGKEFIVNSDGEAMGADEYMATEGGKDGKSEEYNEERESNASDPPSVSFTAYQEQEYGFDAYAEIKTNIQDEYPTLKGTYRPAYKSMASFSPDAVGVSGNNSSTYFKDEMGIPAQFENGKLTFLGGGHESQKSLYAFQEINDSTEQVIGKLNVLSYTEKTKKLYLVSVNGAQLPNETELQTTLNEIYKQSIIKWDVSPATALSGVEFEGATMSHGGSGVTSAFNNDQKTIVNTFAAALDSTNSEMDDDALYLFFVTDVQDKDANIAGYMPLSYNTGFIYGLPSHATIAHELGHGAFNLYHTFSDDNNIAAQMSTENLMDYKGGTELWHYQWDLIHDPQNILFAWGQDESEGEYSTGGVNENTLVFSGDNQEIKTKISENPACYFGTEGGEKIKVEFKTVLKGQDEYPNKIYVKIIVKQGAEILNEEAVILKAGKDEDSGGYITNKTFSFELESTVNYYDNITIKCFVSLEKEGSFEEIKTFKPKIYTTYRPAIYENEMLESILYFSCKEAKVLNKETDIFTAIWDKIKFTTKHPAGSLTKSDFGLSSDDRLGYYNTPIIHGDIEGLLTIGGGTCTAFRDLMLYSLHVQGIPCMSESIILEGDEGFLVKQWDFTEEGSSGNNEYPYINYFDIDLDDSDFSYSKGEYSWIGTPEVYRNPAGEKNLKAQNNDKPRAHFYTHEVVNYNEIIYDPSYGKSFDDIEKWKEESIDGVYIQGEGDTPDGIRATTWLVRKR